MTAVVFTPVPGVQNLYTAEAHGHAMQDLHAGLVAALDGDLNRAAQATLQEVYYSEQHGFGHDCSLHQDVDRALWSPGCGTFRPVTVATNIPPGLTVERREGPPDGGTPAASAAGGAH